METLPFRLPEALSLRGTFGFVPPEAGPGQQPSLPSHPTMPKTLAFDLSTLTKTETTTLSFSNEGGYGGQVYLFDSLASRLDA